MVVQDFLPDEQLREVENIADFAGMLVYDKWTCNTNGRQAIFFNEPGRSRYQAMMIDQGFCFNAGEWNFPDAIVVALAMHHEEPKKSPNLFTLVQVCWRLADAAGYAPIPADREWTYEELIGLIPVASKSWLTEGIDQVKHEIGSRLSSFRL